MSTSWFFLFVTLLFGSSLNDLLCSVGETIVGLRENLTKAIGRLEEADSSVAVSSGGELFLRFISLTSLEHQVSQMCGQAQFNAQVTLRDAKFSVQSQA